MKKEFPIKSEPIKEGKTKSKTKKSNGKSRQASPPPMLKKDVPMYDPQTGQPNPYYEELTGEKNPLEILRKTGKSLENEMLVPPNFQPVLRNRFLVKFPESLGIKPFMVTDIILPVVSMLKPRQPGLTQLFTKSPFEISELEVTMMDSVTEPKVKQLHSILKDGIKFNMSVETLDPMGVVVTELKLFECLITQLNLGQLGYKMEDNLHKIKLSIRPNMMGY